jgi:2-keto-3-deoxy-L-rhamnonate aldolase RhmA
MNAFKQLLANAAERVPVGTWIMSASPLVAEAVGHAGVDWGVVDMEHTPLDMMEVVHLLQALSGTRLVPVVRVPWNDTVTIKRVLDAGAQTLLVPFVQTADEARAAVAATRYPPHGVRGMAGMSRASRFGTVPSFFEAANGEIAVVVQVDTPAAIDRIAQIAAVPGVDAVFVGPGDLSGALGVPGRTGDATVMEACARAVRLAKAAGVPIGTVGGTADAVAQYRAMGFDFVAIASDLGLLMRSLQSAMAAVRGDTPRAPAAPTTQGGY